MWLLSFFFARSTSAEPNLCKPAQLAKQLAEARRREHRRCRHVCGARNDVSRIGYSALKLAGSTRGRCFGIKCEIMIASGTALMKTASKDPFAKQPSCDEVTRFMSVMHKPLPSSLVRRHSSLVLPTDKDWLLKIIAIEGQFVLGVYKREMKAISQLGKLEKILGVPATTRSWNTIEKVVKILAANR